jgi:hypothetical protein
MRKEDSLRYRVTVRFVDGRQRYHIEDIEADSMKDALRAIVDTVPRSVLDTADLVEVRPQVSDEERDYSAG